MNIKAGNKIYPFKARNPSRVDRSNCNVSVSANS
jgi:hypothetical protein